MAKNENKNTTKFYKSGRYGTDRGAPELQMQTKGVECNKNR